MQSAATAFFIDQPQRTRFMLQKLDQLRCRDPQLQCRAGNMTVMRVNDIQGFGQQRRKIFVVNIARDPLIVPPGTPEFRRRRVGQFCGADL